MPPLTADRSAWLSLGGEVRGRFESTADPLWGEQSPDWQFIGKFGGFACGDIRAWSVAPDTRHLCFEVSLNTS